MSSSLFIPGCRGGSNSAPFITPGKKRSGPEGAAKKLSLSLRSLVGHIRRPERRRRRARPPSPLPSLPRRQHNPARPPSTTREEEERGGRPRATEEGRSRPPPPPPASPLLILSSRQAFLPSLFWVRVHSISSFDSCWRRQCRRRRCRLPSLPLPRVAEREVEIEEEKVDRPHDRVTSQSPTCLSLSERQRK